MENKRKEIKDEEKKRIDEITEAISCLTKEERERIYYITKGAQIVASDSRKAVEKSDEECTKKGA